ncbi:MAG: ATP-binding protein [Deltaproteobacteria bacterium]|nr:ATP-binding protein [Deltaproteobacteria bacterium]
MIYRNIIHDLKQWANRSDRKPLILRGARQVGKTTAVDMFSKQFENYIYLNLELGKDRNLFSDDLSVSDTFQAILVIKNVTLKKGKTLLFIDEIQHSPQAVAVLRYFYEKMKDLYVIAAGSLLEIMLEKSDISLPVGRVEYLYMYPLSFDEYLTAKGENKLLDVYHHVPLKKYAHSKLLTLFHEYTLIGGMPEVVDKFLDTRNIKSLNRIYESLLISYRDDAEKYARNHTIRQVLRHAIESIPFEAGKRIKFQGFGRSNYKSREMGEVLRIIERAMLIYLIRPSTSTGIPIYTDLRKSPKLQFVDTGLLNYYVGLQPDYYRYEDLYGFYQGMIAEHIVRQELIAIDTTKNDKPPFWVREKKQSNAEIDLLLQYRNYAIPIEVKSGKSGTLRSLHQYMGKTNHPYAVRFYAGEIVISEAVTPNNKPYRLLNLPYFLAGKIFRYLDWFVDFKDDIEIGSGDTIP